MHLILGWGVVLEQTFRGLDGGGFPVGFATRNDCAEPAGS